MASSQLNLALFDATSATVFSSASFCQIWADAYGMQWEKFGAQGDLGILFTKSRKLGLVNYRLSPLGLYWGNRENNLDLQNEVVATVSSICGRWNTLNLIWNIRYNTQDTLQTTLIRLGDKNCQVRTSATHVLIIAGQSYAQVLARAKSVTRQQVRYGLGAELEV